MPETFRDSDWEFLLRRIRDGLCTPFLGAGACEGILPLGEELTSAWADEYGLPVQDCDDLARVAQYLAVDQDSMVPKLDLVRRFRDCQPPDFTEPNEPHGVLAQLPLPIYLTTNYDDFMVKALETYNKYPQRRVCCWNRSLRESVPEGDASVLQPDETNPVVFHLHGYDHLAKSLVLTEGDYLEFLLGMSGDADIVPPRISEALTDTSLLFIGYSLRDWTFRVLWRRLVEPRPQGSRYLSVAIQLAPTRQEDGEQIWEEAQQFLDRYFEKLFDVRVYWGTAREFCAELRSRWEGSLRGC